MSRSGASKRIIRALEEVAGDDFEILREIGRGGMGWVFLARDLRLNRRVALKVLSPALLMEDGMGERFLREAQILASLRHAHIVGVHAVHHVDDLHWFVMDFIDGPALDQVLGAHDRLELSAVRTIAYMVGSALDYGHHRGRGVIHRDIKPGNVILDSEGAAVVTDFGISKVLTGNTRLTRTGLVVGTPEFMSPEQCSGDEEIDEASDQYSFGALLYQMITGSPPFSGGTVEVLLGHVHKTPPPILDRRPDCPPETAAAVERMLAKSPGDRFPDVAAAVAALGGRPTGLRSSERGELSRLARASVAATGAIDISSPLSPVRGVRPTGMESPQTGESPGVVTLFMGSPSSRMKTGDSIPIWVDARDAEGHTVAEAPIQLRVDRPELASLDNGGLLVAHRSGRVTVTATTGEIERHVTVDIVERPRPARITLDPPVLELFVGESADVSVSVKDQSGEPLEDTEIEWTVSPPAVARVEGAGHVVAEGEGAARITAAADLASASVDVEVRRRPAAIVLDGAPDWMEVDDAFDIRPLVVDADGVPIPGLDVEWSSSNPGVATIDADGRVASAAPGRVVLTATHGDVKGVVEFEVRMPPPPPPPVPSLEREDTPPPDWSTPPPPSRPPPTRPAPETPAPAPARAPARASSSGGVLTRSRRSRSATPSRGRLAVGALGVVAVAAAGWLAFGGGSGGADDPETTAPTGPDPGVALDDAAAGEGEGGALASADPDAGPDSSTTVDPQEAAPDAPSAVAPPSDETTTTGAAPGASEQSPPPAESPAPEESPPSDDPAPPTPSPTRSAAAAATVSSPLAAEPPVDLPPAEIRIRVRPEAVTSIDGVARPDSLRSTNILSLPPGQYRVRLSRPGFVAFDTLVVLEPEQVLVIRKNLDPSGVP